ncbi:MAG: response regulator [Chloroflexi bacterium]|nr:response regulator [Chloroflexota bacterium]
MSDEQEEALSPIKTIVVVEDDSTNAEVFEVLLTAETQCKTLLMANGQEALQRIEEIKAIKPALFLLDYHLPAMTALELYDQFQKIEELKNIPTFIITASNPASIAYEIAKRGLSLIEKPFEVDALITTIQQVLDAPSA